MSRPVLILGASGGIGGAIARALSEAGHQLILHGRDRAKLLRLASDLGSGAATEIANLSQPEEAAALMKRVGQTHDALGGVVFSVATPFANRLAHRTPWSAFEEQLTGQLKAFHHVASCALPLLEGAGRSRMVVVSTEFVMGVPPIKTAPYVAAKAALTAYAQVIAQEWLAKGVRVHIVAPGLVKTDLVADMPDAYLDDLAERMPEKRLTSAEDVGRFASFLFTDAADPMYGTPLRISRGARR